MIAKALLSGEESMRYGVVAISFLALMVVAGGFAFAAACTDTDGGKNAALKGTVTTSGKTYTDYCLSSTKVKEYYCNKNSASSVSQNCPSGTACTAGECKATPTPSPSASPSPNATVSPSPSSTPTPSPTVSCSDSDNSAGFPNYLATLGTCTDSAGSYQDASFDSLSVTEYYCGPVLNSPDQQTCLYTEHSCQAQGWDYSIGGKCVTWTPPAIVDCIDDDGGMIYDKKGTCTDSVKSYVDYKVDDLSYREYYCTPYSKPRSQQVCASSRVYCVIDAFTVAGSGDGVCLGSPRNPTPTPTPGTTIDCFDSDAYLGDFAYLGQKSYCTDYTGTYWDSTVTYAGNTLIGEYRCAPLSNPPNMQTCMQTNMNCKYFGFPAGAGPDGACLTSVTGGATRKGATNFIERFFEWFGGLFR